MNLPQVKKEIAFVDLKAQRRRLGRKLELAIARVMDHGAFILGPEVTELEHALAEFCGAQHCVACANGTDALMLVLMVENIGLGDAVFVPSFTFVATAEAVAEQRATPVFVDVDRCTFNIQVESLERSIIAARNGGLHPRMVIAVDLFGQPADYTTISAVAERYGLIVVADAAQAFGARLGANAVGTLARYTTTSFFPSKPLGCYGDGGAIFTDDENSAAHLRSLTMHGMGSNKHQNVRIGLNSRLDTIQAAILLEKLAIFPEEIEARTTIARRYSTQLARLVEPPRLADGMSSVWAQYTVPLPQYIDRTAIQLACKQAGIPTAVYYPLPLHLQPAYASYPRDPDGLPISEELSRRVLSLPMHAYLDKSTQDEIIAVVLERVHRNG